MSSDNLIEYTIFHMKLLKPKSHISKNISRSWRSLDLHIKYADERYLQAKSSSAALWTLEPPTGDNHFVVGISNVTH